jgi:hypothetical protein
MLLRDRHVPEDLAQRGPVPFAAFLLRVVLAGVFTAALVWIASVAMLLDTAPAWVSLVFEPLSLFLLPGLVVAMVTAGKHDLNPSVVVAASGVFYFVCFLVALERRACRRRRRG